MNRLLLKFVLLYHMDTQESSDKDNPKFNFLEIIWENSLKSKFWQPLCQLRGVMGLLETFHFQLLGWNVWHIRRLHNI